MNKQNKWEEVDERFYNQLVEMSPLFGRDMHNRPPLYELKDDKVEEIIKFVHSEILFQLEEVEKEKEELKRYVRKGNPKCSWCGKPATEQTAKGEENLKSGGLEVNDDWYCDDCYKKGLEEEEEAMYGN